MTLLAVAVQGRGLVDPAEPVFGADDEALLRGAAAFETLRVYDGRPFRLDEHLARFAASASALELAPAGDVRALVELLLAAAPPDHVLRLYRTSASLVATAAAIPPGLDQVRAQGVTLRSVELARPLLEGVKVTSYAENLAARARAAAAGADDALLVSGGIVRESSTANVWWRRGEELYTPSLETGVLPGVTRGFVLEHADTIEGAFQLEDLIAADEAFLTSSIREVMPVVGVDGHAIGDGRPGPAAARLQAALRSAG